MNKRILVISTDVEMSDMLQIYFTRLEYLVECFSSLDKAIELVDIEKLDVILFDSGVAYSELPSINSIESKIRSTFPNVPIFWILTRDDRPDKITSLELGADDFISKPFDIEELKLRVRNAIRAVERSKASKQG